MDGGRDMAKVGVVAMSWLMEAKGLADAVGMMSEGIELLGEKRETLEEKMIKSYFHSLSIACCQCIEKVHAIMVASPERLADESIGDLHALREELLAALGELLKIMRYNWNFLEQYFEFDFNAKLHHEFLFQERLEKVNARLDQLIE